MLKKYIPEGKYSIPVTSALVRGEERVVLIDAALGKNLVSHLAARGITPDDVEAVLITHMHFDHIDGLIDKGKAVFPRAKLYISERELDYWQDSTNIERFPEQQRMLITGFFKKSQGVITAYQDRIIPIAPGGLTDGGTMVLPGIYAMAAYGHTPGHTAFLLQSQEKRLLVLGDAWHVGLIQFPLPDIAVVYDSDSEEAARTRHALFSYAAEKGIPVTGMHQCSPEIGLLQKHPEEVGGYTLNPFP